jgi:catechol 2,3-dioxygenase-like lactoylglutathione lyase family enzyme
MPLPTSTRRALPAIAALLAVSSLTTTILSRAAEPPPASHASTSRSVEPTSTPLISSVASISIPVSNLDRSLDFFTGILAFEKVSEHELVGEQLERTTSLFGARARVATLRLGDEQIELIQYLAPEGRPLPVDSRSNDLWFQHIAIVVSDIDAAYTHLRSHHVRHASTGPQTLPQSIPNAAGISAFYFKDPDGHALEIIHFPKDKGDPRWHTPRNASALFLGIDHTAIAVRDTDASLRFYRDTLGLTVAGGSENFGTEQEHLNNVFGARLLITTLKAPKGPGIELLEYLSPTDARPYPADSRANDLWQWHTTLITSNPAGAVATLRLDHARFISIPLPTTPNSPFMVRDPDGHALLLRTLDDATR